MLETCCNDFCMQAYQSNQILVRSSASLQRDFLDVTSFCEIISQLLLIDMSADHCLTFNVGSGRSLSLYQLSSIISTEAMSRFNKSLNISILQSHSQINRPLQYSIDKLSSYGISDYSLSTEIHKIFDFCETYLHAH